MNKGKLIIFTGPSAVGKATIEKLLFKHEELRLKFSVSATTRDKRKGEKDKKHYFFLSQDDFDKKIKANEFVEWSFHFNNRYGTLKSQIKDITESGYNAFLEVDVNGAKDISLQYPPSEFISIFIAPPSKGDLEKRIRNRGTENEEQIKNRLERVDKEMSKIHYFNHVVVNDVPERAAEKIANIITGSLNGMKD